MRRPLCSSWKALWQQRMQSWVARRNRNRRMRRRAAGSRTGELLETRQMLSSTYGSGTLNLAIPDQGQVLSTINVPDSLTIGDVNVTLDVDHTRDQDLDVYLISPSGTRIELMTDVGGGGDDFSGTILDDEAATPITSGSAPFSGTYRPEGSLSAVDGEDAQGDWTLEVNDDRRRQTGTLISWSLDIEGSQPSLSIDNVALVEGDSGTTEMIFTVTRSVDTSGSSSVDFATVDGTARAGSDYVQTSGTLQFLSGETTQTISVEVNGDTDFEPDELFTVQLSNPTNAAIVDSSGTGTIEDDDAPASLISYWAAENDGLDSAGSNDGTLVSGAAYAPGQIGQAFAFDGVDDRVLIPDDPSLHLTASMTIEGWVRVDAFPTIGHGLILFRGDDRGGLDPYQLTTTTNGEIRFGVSALTGGTSVFAPMPQGEFVHVAATLDDATGDMSLYLNGALAAHQVTSIRPFQGLDPNSNPGIGIGNHGGYPTTPHNFPFNGLIDELKVYDQALSAADVLANYIAGFGDTILAINDAQVIEGDSGTTTLTFTVTRQGDLSGVTSVDWTTTDGTATVADGDYIAAGGQLSFGPGETEETITITVNGDLTEENHELFSVDLSNISGAVLADQSGAGTILNDETSIVINDAVVTEGADGWLFTDAFVANGNGGLDTPRNVTFGPDGNLYASSISSDEVLRYDGETGQFIDVFVSANSGGIDNPWALQFGTDGHLYVSGRASNNVVRYDGTTGAFIDEFVPSGSGGLTNPKGMVFGPDGNLFVSSDVDGQGGTSGEILRYDGSSGVFLDVFVDGGGGLDNPHGIAFGPDGNLYVADSPNDSIRRYNGATGAFIDDFVTAGSGGLSGPKFLEFRGSLVYVVSGGGLDAILTYDAATGAFVEQIADSRLNNPHGLTFDSVGHLLVANSVGDDVLRFAPAATAVVNVSLSAASGETVSVDFSTADGTAVAGSDYVSTSGTLVFAPGETQRSILVGTINDANEEPSESFFVNLGVANGATIVDPQGEVTILDDDTEFVDDYATSEATAEGSVTSGSLADTQASDDVSEAIRETETGGKPSNRTTLLEHTWTFNVTGGDTVTFFVEAWHTANSEGDDFLFAYSTDGTNFTDMLAVTKTADDDAAQSYEFPAGTSGTVTIRVTDTDQTPGNRTRDTLYVDEMYIRSESAPAAAMASVLLEEDDEKPAFSV